MSEIVKQSVVDVVLSPRTAGAVSGGTLLAALSEKFQLLPWGSIAAAVGAALSAVMIFIQLWRAWDDRKGHRLERRRLHLQIEALEDKARLRRANGQPLRRDEDSTYCPSTQTGEPPDPKA